MIIFNNVPEGTYKATVEKAVAIKNNSNLLLTLSISISEEKKVYMDKWFQIREAFIGSPLFFFAEEMGIINAADGTVDIEALEGKAVLVTIVHEKGIPRITMIKKAEKAVEGGAD